MKKEYVSPEMAIVKVELQQFVAASSDFMEGETDNVGTGSDYGDPSGADSRRFDPWEW